MPHENKMNTFEKPLKMYLKTKKKNILIAEARINSCKDLNAI